jgi:glycosyltransferase involved in cell wall biosynthesis
MSVVVVTPDRYEVIRKTIRHLQAQSVRDQLEVVIVAPSADKLGLDESELKDFLQFRVVEVGAIRSTGGAIAAGMLQAQAPVVAYAEEHSYPFPGWAEALIEAHRQPWAAVGAILANANPGTMASWTSLFTDFGPWVEPAVPGVIRHLPWHHTAYKRAPLLAYDDLQLQAMLETEGILHRDLQAKGYQLYLEPAARANHVNVSSRRSLIRSEFFGGRLFGAARARYERWSVFRRLLYISGGPLIPLVRLRRTVRDIRRSGRHRDLLPGILPSLILGLTMHGLGEIMGYAFGAGEAVQRRVSFELNRCRHVAERDRKENIC